MVFSGNSEIKKGEKKLKKIMGGKHTKNASFKLKMEINDISNKKETWNFINNQITLELQQGNLKISDIETRIDELLLSQSPNSQLADDYGDVMVASQKYKLMKNKRIVVEIPYVKSGVNDALLGEAFFGRSGAVLGSLNEGSISWRQAHLLLVGGGISIDSTGQVSLYKNIDKAIISEKKLLSAILTIISKNGDNLVLKATPENAEAIKLVIDENLIEDNDIDDPLLKYAELYEKGLLTKEEFEMKKAELLYSNKNEKVSLKSEDIPENKHLFCGNCGTPIDADSNFCINCGFKITK